MASSGGAEGSCKPGAFLRFETPRQKPARRQQTLRQTQTLMITTICAVFLFFFDDSQAVGICVGAGESHAGAPTAVVSTAPRSTPASDAALSRATSTSSVVVPSIAAATAAASSAVATLTS